MKLRQPPRLVNRKLIDKFLEVDLWSWLRELTSGFSRLNFKDNFQSFTVENLAIKAGEQVAIANQLPDGQVPTGRIITRQTGNAVIVDGVTPWNSSFVYLKNPSANDAIVTVIFF